MINAFDYKLSTQVYGPSSLKIINLETMLNLFHLTLRAYNENLNINRYYTLGLDQDLFKDWVVTFCNGRWGRGGMTKKASFDSIEEAFQFIHKKLKKRLTAPNRIACSYKIAVLEGCPAILNAGLLNKDIMEKFHSF